MASIRESLTDFWRWIRPRLESLRLPRAIPGWFAFVWGVLDSIQTVDWLGGKLKGSAVLNFLGQWGWAVGLVWLTLLVIFYRNPAAKQTRAAYELKESAQRFAWRYYAALEAYGVTPDQTKEQRPATVDLEWALRDLLRAFLRSMPNKGARERAARALFSARAGLVKEHPELRPWRPDELFRFAHKDLENLDLEDMDVDGER